MLQGKFYSFVFDVDEETFFWLKHKALFGSGGFEAMRIFLDCGARVQIKCRLLGKFGNSRSFKSLSGICFMVERNKYPYCLDRVTIKFFE
jgi:hypothetical protein